MLFFVICNGGQKARGVVARLAMMYVQCSIVVGGHRGHQRKVSSLSVRRVWIGSDTARLDCGNKHAYHSRHRQSPSPILGDP